MKYRIVTNKVLYKLQVKHKREDWQFIYHRYLFPDDGKEGDFTHYQANDLTRAKEALELLKSMEWKPIK